MRWHWRRLRSGCPPTNPERPTWPRTLLGPQKPTKWQLIRDLIVAAICFGLVFAIFRWRPFGVPDPTKHPAVGQAADFLELYPVEKVASDLAAGVDPLATARPLTSAEVTGSVVVIYFWGPWVIPSVEGLEKLVAVLPVVSRRDFRFLPVACPPPPERGEAGDFIGDIQTVLRGLRPPVVCYLDLRGASQAGFAVASRAQTGESVPRSMALPATVLVDRDLVIRAVWVGWIPGQERRIAVEVDRLLENSQPSTTAHQSFGSPTGRAVSGNDGHLSRLSR